MEPAESLEDMVTIPYPQHPHCATVLVLDTSSSMDGTKIHELNEGLQIFTSELLADELARKRVDVAIVTFGSKVLVVQEFTGMSDFTPPTLTARGFSPMGEAILTGIDLVKDRKEEYRAMGVDYYRPWIFVITDGYPTDMRRGDERWNRVIEAVHGGEAEQKFLFWMLGVDPADMQILHELSPPNRSPLKLKEARFADMFMWLSKSLTKISDSRIGDDIMLENPVGPQGWGIISL
ncbi:MAG: VWA domain-containing protein [Methanospirillaceae archaeon]|nr:VWA domain-containing protein [Methanospirillaceae archaeon]